MNEVEIVCGASGDGFNPAAVSHEGDVLLLVRVAEAPPPDAGHASALIFDSAADGGFRTSSGASALGDDE